MIAKATEVANPLLRYPIIVLDRLIALMSGSLALFREAYTLYSGKPTTPYAFWGWVRIAFIISAFIAWFQERAAVSTERKGREDAEAALNDVGPKLYFEYSDEGMATLHLTHSGLSVGNSGQTDATRVQLYCNLTEHYRLYFEDMPIQRIGRGSKVSVNVRTHEQRRDGTWGSVGGTPGMQIEGCFERMRSKDLELRIPIAITCLDDRRKERTTAWVIRHSQWPEPERIWCEPA